MTLQMAIGKMIVEKIVGHPDKYPEEVVAYAQNVITRFGLWKVDGTFHKNPRKHWHNDSGSWSDFKKVAREHNISLPEVLQEEQ